MVKISEMVPVEEEEYVVFDADKKRMFNAFASDDAYAMRFRQDVKEGAKAEDYFGYVKTEKPKNYVSAAFRGVANTVIGAVPSTVRRFSRMGTDYVVSHLNEKDEDYIKRTEKMLADLDAKTPEEQAKFYNNDVLFNSREALEAEIRHVKTRLADRKSRAFAEEVNGVYDRLKKKNDAWIESFGFAKRPEDSEFMYGLGAASTSLLMSLGLSVVTKSAWASSVLFGFSQAGNIYEEVREKGGEPGTALKIASAAGTAEAALEAWGLHKLVESMGAKTWIKSAAKGFLSESVQEMSQQGLEEFLMRDYRQDEQAEEKIKRVLYSGIYGGILGSSFAIGLRPFVKRHARETEKKLLECGVNKEDAAKMVEDAAFGNAKEREKAVLDIQRAIEVSELVKEGFSEQDAEQIAKSIAVTDDEMKRLLSETAEAEADPQAYEGGSIEAGVQYMDKRLAEINPFDEDFDIKERVKTAALENGVSEEQAELAGTLTENFSRVIANVTNESPAEQWENGAELIIEGVRPPKMEEMTEVNEGDSDTDYWDAMADEEAAAAGAGNIADTFDYTGESVKGTYMGADGRIHMQDGTVLFQSEKAALSIVTKDEIGNRTAEQFKSDMIEKMESYRGMKIPNKSIGADIEIRSSSIRKYKSFFADENKRLIVPHIPELLGKAEFVKENSYMPEKERNVKAYWKSDLTANIDGKTFNVHFTVKEDNNGGFFWDAQVKEKAFQTDPATNPGVERLASENPEDTFSVTSYKADGKRRFYQRAFAGSRVDYDKPSLEAINSGEGAQVHGWGLYYALNKDVAEGYREKFTKNKYGDKGQVHEVNVPENPYLLDEQKPFSEQSGFVQEKVKDIEKETGQDVLLFGQETSGEAVYARLQYLLGSAKAASGLLSKHGIKGITYEGNEDGRCFVIFDDKDVSVVQRFYQSVRANVADVSAARDINDIRKDAKAYMKDIVRKQNIVHPELGKIRISGKGIDEFFKYSADARKMALVPHLKELIETSNAGKREAPKHERKDGIVGFIPLYNEAVIDGQSVKTETLVGVDRKGNLFYDVFLDEKRSRRNGGVETESTVASTASDINITLLENKSKRRYRQSAKARGYIDVTDAGFVIRLLKNADPSTIVHELGHYFTIRYLSALNKAGRIDEAADVLDWLGVKDVSGLQTEHYEKFARGFETYVMEGVAPNAGLKALFARFKNFLLGVYRDLVTGKVVKPEEINDDVRAFFDRMFAIDEDAAPVDLDAMKGKTDALRKVVSSAMKGEQISVEGMGINEIEGVLNLMNARIPRKPKNLEQMLRSVGGIDMDFAKQFDLLQLMGVQDKKGGAGGLFKKDGVINREDALVGFLKENGFIRGEETDAASSADLWYQALAALENAKELYTPDGMAQMDRRNNIIGAAEEAAKILSGHDYDAVVKAVKTLKRADVAAASKDTLKYIRAKIANIQKDYEKLVKSMIKAAKKDFANIQKDLQAFIKNQPISAESKVKLLSRAKNATDLAKYYKIAETIKSKALEYYDLEARKFLRGQIEKEVKQSRPSSVEKQRYDYENNSLFADLRKYAGMTQSEAKAAADGMRRGMNEDDVSELRETDKIRLRFLEAKAQGAKASKELLAAVLEDIQNAKTAGREAKDAADHENAVNREQERQEILEKLKYSEADEDRLKTKFMNVYRRGFANLYSMLNSMFGRDIAEKYQFEVLQTKTDTAIFEKIESSMKSAAGIFGVKDRDLPALFVKMTENKRDLYDKDLNRFKLNTFDVMDIYNAIKNDKTREDYNRAFGKENVALLVSSLSREEKLFADYLMREVNAYYDKMNAVYIKMYAIDLPKVENYWPATSLHKDQIDILGDFQGQSDIPSSLKERSKHAVTPRPQNAVEKFNRHVAEAEYVTSLGLPYMEAKRIFKSERIKNGIINHFGAGVYKDLTGNLESLSLKNRFERIDAVTGRLNKLLNNVVLAKIALAPSVFVKQLISVTNYAEQVGYAEWAKGFAEALAHPVKTVREMKEALPFLKARLAGGNNEALIIALAGKRTVWKDMLSALTRYGDLAAVVYGGYPYFKKLKESGAPDIEEKFMFATLRSMQSGTAVSLSPFQRNAKGWRIFTMFKNTPQQYMRKLVDALVMKKNGDISKEEFRRVMVNYGIVQPTLLALVSLGWAEMWKEFVFNTDDEDEEEEGKVAAAVLREVLLNPFAGVPIVSSLVEAGVNKATGDRVYGMSSLLLDDVNDALLTFNKQDKDVFDYLTMIAPVVEAVTAAPASRATRFVKKLKERSEDK